VGSLDSILGQQNSQKAVEYDQRELKERHELLFVKVFGQRLGTGCNQYIAIIVKQPYHK